MFEPTRRTTAYRHLNRIAYDRTAAYRIVDEARYCHLSFVIDGEPRILPTMHVRVEDTLYLHGSTGSRPMLAARIGGIRVCVAITLIDGLVLARSQFHHSVNYRSVIAHGRAAPVTSDAEKRTVLTTLVNKLVPGRAAHSRPPTRKELGQTSVLGLPLTEVSVKERRGRVADEPDDYALSHWAGVVPLRLVIGTPEPDGMVSGPPPFAVSQSG